MGQGTSVTATGCRDLLLKAGAEVFASRGYAHAEIDDICRAAGVSVADFRGHFSSKKELYAALAKEIRDELIARGREAMAGASTLETRVKAAWELFFRYVEEKPARAYVLTTAALGVEELHMVMHAIQDEATRQLAQLLIAEPNLLPGDASREVRLQLCMEFIRSGMHGLARWWARHPDVPRTELTSAISAVAWHGLSDLKF